MPRNQLHTMVLAAASIAVIALVGWRAGAASERRALAAPVSMAVVDVEEAFFKLDELKELNGQLETRVKERQADIDALTSELEELNAQIGQLPSTETDERRKLVVRAAELEELRKAKKGIYERLIAVEEGEIIQPLYTKLLAAVNEVATKHGYDFVLFDDTELTVPRNTKEVVNHVIQQKRILYAAESLDITGEVVLLMNQKYQAGVE